MAASRRALRLACAAAVARLLSAPLLPGFVGGAGAGIPRETPRVVNRRAEETMTPEEYMDKGRQEYPDAMIAAAVVQGEDDTARELIEKGLPLEARGAKGRTALMFAAWKGNLDMTKLLAEKGAKVDAQDESGRTPLALAATQGHADVVRWLIDNKSVDTEVVDRGGLTALLWACVEGQAAAVKALLDKGANAEHKDEDGMTPLKLSAAFDRVDVAELLVESGAEKAEALALAQRVHRNPEMISLLES